MYFKQGDKESDRARKDLQAEMSADYLSKCRDLCRVSVLFTEEKRSTFFYLK